GLGAEVELGAVAVAVAARITVAARVIAVAVAARIAVAVARAGLALGCDSAVRVAPAGLRRRAGQRERERAGDPGEAAHATGMVAHTISHLLRLSWHHRAADEHPRPRAAARRARHGSRSIRRRPR